VQCCDLSPYATCLPIPSCACPRVTRSWWVGRRTLCAEELAGDVQGLAAHNDDLLAVEQLLGDGAGEATEQVPLAVDDLNHKSARGSCACAILVRARRGIGDVDRDCQFGNCVSCTRKVRTITGSKVDILSNPGVCWVVSCRGRGYRVAARFRSLCCRPCAVG